MMNPVRGSGALTIALLLACGGLSAPRAFAEDAKPYVFRRAVVLCIGIDKYRFINEVQFAESDAKSVGESLRERYGFTPRYLLGPQATKDAILGVIRSYTTPRLESGGPNPEFLGEQDILIIYFAGHGQVISVPLDPRNPSGRRGFLIPYEARLPADLKDFRNPGQWEREAIDMRELVGLIEAMKAEHVLVLVDACCSGFMTQRGNYLSSRYDLQLLLTGRSRAVLAATTDKQGATWDEKLGHGYFTAALLDELKSWSDRGEAASLTDVSENVRFQVSNTTRGGMVPQMNSRIGPGDGEFVFLPKSLRPADVDYAVRQAATLRDKPGPGLGRGNILTKVLERAAVRQNMKATSQDVFEAFEATDYRFSSRPGDGTRVWEQKFERFQVTAGQGDPLAMAALHYCYSKGLGTEKSPSDAYRLARLAYDTGQPAGKHVLGRCLLNGIGVEKNEEAAWRLIEEAAKAGFAISQFSLAGHLIGDRRTNPKERIASATGLYEEAAKAGLASAMLALANLHAGTLPGTTRDANKAIELLNAAAAKGLSQAKLTLYDIYSSGLPEVPKNLEKARGFLNSAAEDGFAPAQNNLACEFYQKRGVKSRLELAQDSREAAKWAELAARQNDLPSHLLMCDFYEFGDGAPVDFAKAIDYCEKAAKENFAPAFARQARWYIQGTVYPRDFDKAVHSARKAALGGDPVGQFLLGTLYEDKLIPPLPNDYWGSKDFPIYEHHALHWYVQSAKQGFAPAAEKAREHHKKIQKSALVYFQFFQRDYPEDAKEFVRMFGPKPKD